MKKFFLLVVAAMMTVVTVQAQSGYEDTKHEVAVSLGGASNSQWIDVFEDVFVSMVGYRFEDGSAFGPLSVEYFYRLKDWLGIGGIFVYGHSEQDVYQGKVEKANFYGVDKNNYYTLMPAAKFDWLRKKNFGVYSKVGVGATLRTEKTDYKDDKDNYDESTLHVNWQLSLLGLEAGGPKFRGFVELGCGEQGIALIGLRYKFGSR